MSGFGVTETVLVLVWALLLIVPIVLAFVVSYSSKRRSKTA